jgi:hypothetical protein
MTMTDFALLVIAFALLLILLRVISIDKRLKERFPTEREADYKWSQDNPMGRAEAHSKERNK